ncbi:MAG TPA: hypothetical protein VEU74_12900 [Gemmatimonadales bacterium]|nr:hypothetical protein [Gemmatimonadales bacterium]
MMRTILSAAVLIGLAACSKSGSRQSSARGGAAHSTRPAATQSRTGTTAAPSQTQQQKKKGTAKPDTGRTKNPLTNN